MKTQTNRTILFEKVNEEKDTILSLIHMQNAKESLSDEEVQAIHRALEVSGFADFVEKFSPAVYMFLDPEKGIVRFTRECTLQTDPHFAGRELWSGRTNLGDALGKKK